MNKDIQNRLRKVAAVLKQVSDIKTISDIKRDMLADGRESHWFDKKTMQFFGDTMKNFGVRKEDGKIVVYRKKPVKHGINFSYVYDPVKKTLKSIDR